MGFRWAVISMSGMLWYQLDERFLCTSKSRLTGINSSVSPWKPPSMYVVLWKKKQQHTNNERSYWESMWLLWLFIIPKMSGLWPVHLEVSQSHSHYIHNRRDLSIAFTGLLGKAVLDWQQTEVSDNDIGGRGGLGQEDDGSVEVDVQSDTSAPLCQLLHTWRCFLCSLNCHLSQGIFSLLKVIDECLRGRMKRKQQNVGKKLLEVWV